MLQAAAHCQRRPVGLEGSLGLLAGASASSVSIAFRCRAGAISAARCIVPQRASASARPETVPGTATAKWPVVLARLMTLLFLSSYIRAVVASGAFSRTSKKALRPSTSCRVMKQPRP